MGFRRKYRFKSGLFILTSLLIGFTTAVISLYYYKQTASMIMKEFDIRATITARSFAYQSFEGIIVQDPSIFQHICQGILQEKNLIYTLIYNKKGILLYRQYKGGFEDLLNLFPKRLKKFQPDSREIQKDIIEIKFGSQTFNLLDIRQAVKERDRPEETIGYVRIGISLKDIDTLKKRLIRNSFLISLIIIGIGLAFSLGFSKKLSKPLSLLAEAMESIIQKHDFSKRIKQKSEIIEVDEIQTYFNKMAEYLETTTTSRDLLTKEITERKQAEEEKEKLQGQLLQAQKMEAIGILAGGVAHDFNNLLQAIKGYTDLAMMRVNEADPLYRDLRQIDISAGRAASLTRQLLLFSRRQPMEFTPVNINTTVENLLKMLRRLIGEDISIKTELDPELWTTEADTGNIEQVIMNLTVNARDAMPEGGIITIRTENVHVDKKYCKTHTYARPGKFACLTVEDTGVGMDKETVQRIFEPFFSTKGPGKGTGLGLSVIYGIVKQHEGWVDVYSEPGQGSTFKIYLPVSSLVAEDDAKETISLKDLQGNGERILLVEDEEEVREFATEALSKNGYVIYDAANAEQALDIFEREAGNFDLIFSDVVLTGKSGLQFVDQLLSRKPSLHVLLSSGYTDHKSQWLAIQERGFRFLQKPYALNDLFKAIREAMGKDK